MEKIAILLTGILVFATNVTCAQVRIDEQALQDIESITLLPLVLPAEVEFDSEDKGRKKARRELSRNLALKGYVLDNPRNWTVPEEWTYEAMKAMTPEEIAKLAPESSDHFAVGFIDSIASSSNVVSSKAAVTVSAKIIDRSSGRVVWENSESRETKENIINVGLFIMALTDDELMSMYYAFVELFEELPEKEY